MTTKNYVEILNLIQIKDFYKLLPSLRVRAQGEIAWPVTTIGDFHFIPT